MADNQPHSDENAVTRRSALQSALAAGSVAAIAGSAGGARPAKPHPLEKWYNSD